MSPTQRSFKAREFAELAGVTVRALHHYDRIGLLRPRRTQAGYRVYSTQDLQALEQIVVLKFIGIPLRRIAGLRAASADRLAESLRVQRGMLEQRRRLLDQAIAAIRELETSVGAGHSVAPAMFRRINEVIHMQNNSEAWTKEYESLVRKKVDRLRSLSPEHAVDLRAHWNTLLVEIRDALTEDPSSEKAQDLAFRWTQLLARLMGEPISEGDLAKHHGVQAWDTRMASFVEKPVWDFMSQVLAVRK